MSGQTAIHLKDAGLGDVLPGVRMNLPPVELVSLDLARGTHVGHVENEGGTIALQFPTGAYPNGKPQLVEIVSVEDTEFGKVAHAELVDGKTDMSPEDFKAPYEKFLQDLESCVREHIACTRALPDDYLKMSIAFARSIAGAPNYILVADELEKSAVKLGIDPSGIEGTPFDRANKLTKEIEIKSLGRIRELVLVAKDLDAYDISSVTQTHFYQDRFKELNFGGIDIAAFNREVKGDFNEAVVSTLERFAVGRGFKLRADYASLPDTEKAKYLANGIESLLSRKQKPRKKSRVQSSDWSLEDVAAKLAITLEEIAYIRSIDTRTKSLTPTTVELIEARYKMLEEMLTSACVYYAVSVSKDSRISADEARAMKIQRIETRMEPLIAEVKALNKGKGAFRPTRDESIPLKEVARSYRQLTGRLKQLKKAADNAASILWAYDELADKMVDEMSVRIVSLGERKTKALALIESTRVMTSPEEMSAVYDSEFMKQYFDDVIALPNRAKSYATRLAGLKSRALRAASGQRGRYVKESIGDMLFDVRGRRPTSDTNQLRFLRDFESMAERQWGDYFRIASVEKATISDLPDLLRISMESQICAEKELLPDNYALALAKFIETEGMYCIKNSSGTILGSSLMASGLNYNPKGSAGVMQVKNTRCITGFSAQSDNLPGLENEFIPLILKTLRDEGAKEVYCLGPRGKTDSYKLHGFEHIGVCKRGNVYRRVLK
jgi:hypothetical protein